MASNKDKIKRILCSEWLLSCTTQWKETGGREHGRTGGVRGREAGEQGAGSGSRNKEGDSCDRTSTNA